MKTKQKQYRQGEVGHLVAEMPTRKKPYRRKTVMVNGTQCLLSRHIMSQCVQRPLSSNEIVYHNDGNPFNNNINNLQIVSRSEHKRIHADIGIGTRLKKVWALDPYAIYNMYSTQTSAHIAAQFGCSDRTILRILKTIKSLQYDLRTTRWNKKL